MADALSPEEWDKRAGIKIVDGMWLIEIQMQNFLSKLFCQVISRNQCVVVFSVDMFQDRTVWGIVISVPVLVWVTLHWFDYLAGWLKHIMMYAS